MRADGYDAKVTALLRREGFFKSSGSYLGHTVEDMQPHLHLEGEDRANLRNRLFSRGIRCQLKLPGCTGIATEMDHAGEAAEANRFDELAHVRRTCTSCHRARHNREVKFGPGREQAINEFIDICEREDRQ